MKEAILIGLAAAIVIGLPLGVLINFAKLKMASGDEEEQQHEKSHAVRNTFIAVFLAATVLSFAIIEGGTSATESNAIPSSSVEQTAAPAAKTPAPDSESKPTISAAEQRAREQAAYDDYVSDLADSLDDIPPGVDREEWVEDHIDDYIDDFNEYYYDEEGHFKDF